MVKIIEQSYLHAHAIPAGDLKHYAITLMEKGVPVRALLSRDEVSRDVESAIHEVEARGASVTIINSLVPELGEVSAIANVVPLQLLAYYLGVQLGNDIDKPRNIAKSVTVK
jgi:glucosamine--fructose-6-phosphate aminotransferase (isomerizing)